jgi:hypothetical protein
VLTAIGNSSDQALRSAADNLRQDPNPVVAEAAVWAVDQLERDHAENGQSRPGTDQRSS